MVINPNTAAPSAARNRIASSNLLARSLARLSSGSKISNPVADTAGMAVSLRLDAQVSRTNAARAKVGNAISFMQTQDGYLTKIGKALERMRELAILSQDVTKSDADRALYNGEFTQLAAFVTTSATKDFNGVSLFSAAGLPVTVDSEGAPFTLSGINLGTTPYSTATASGVSTTTTAATALTNVKAALTQLATDRAAIGASQSRLNFTSDQLAISKENLDAASSRIRDVDVAEESTQFARYSILVQSATAMLAQANQSPQSVLRLLQ